MTDRQLQFFILHNLRNHTLEELLRPMTERQREACRLRYLREWPIARIARRLGIGKSGVCQLLARARAKYPRLKLPKPRQPKKRTVRMLSLSDVYEV